MKVRKREITNRQRVRGRRKGEEKVERKESFAKLPARNVITSREERTIA